MNTDRFYLVTKMDGHIVSCLLHASRAVEIHCDEEQDHSILENIYIGRIKNIAKNIGAAFVELTPGLTCYLALDEIRNPVYTRKGSSRNPQAGDELLVQVIRDSIKTKAPAVTTNLSLHGKYALLTTGNPRISVSAKLPQSEKERLFGIVRAYESKLSDAEKEPTTTQPSDEPPGCTQESDTSKKERLAAGLTDRPFGWLIRTNAGGIAPELLEQDLAWLHAQYLDLMKTAQYRTCGSCLLGRPPAYLKRLTDLYDTDADRIVTDDPALYAAMHDYLAQHQSSDLAKLTRYEDRLLPLAKLYSLERHLKEALSERVWLKSGGYLVIQPTEALTVIDVNTGKYEGGKQKEATFLRINREAAVEIARQLRLRNLSGIILVDFINMESRASNDALLSLLDQELSRDPIRTVLVDMTKLSLVEITRQKRERPLRDTIGRTRSVTTVNSAQD